MEQEHGTTGGRTRRGRPFQVRRARRPELREHRRPSSPARPRSVAVYAHQLPLQQRKKVETHPHAKPLHPRPAPCALRDLEPVDARDVDLGERGLGRRRFPRGHGRGRHRGRVRRRGEGERGGVRLEEEVRERRAEEGTCRVLVSARWICSTARQGANAPSTPRKRELGGTYMSTQDGQ